MSWARLDPPLEPDCDLQGQKLSKMTVIGFCSRKLIVVPDTTLCSEVPFKVPFRANPS